MNKDILTEMEQFYADYVKFLLLKNPEIQGNVIIAGGVFTKEIRDIDIYQYKEYPLNIPDKEVLFETKNSTTIKGTTHLLQYCTYKKPTLKELIDSFDYGHIKIGVAYYINGKTIEILEVYISEDFKRSLFTNHAVFTSSEYPLSSLIRLHKYHERGLVPKNILIRNIFKLITMIVKRGFSSYEDFKDQLDAIDLGLVPEELSSLEKHELIELYETLKK